MPLKKGASEVGRYNACSALRGLFVPYCILQYQIPHFVHSGEKRMAGCGFLSRGGGWRETEVALGCAKCIFIWRHRVAVLCDEVVVVQPTAK